MVEIWKDIPGYEGLYQASTEGRIRSLDRVATGLNGKSRIVYGKILSPNIAKDKRLSVQLSHNGIVKRYTISVLIALTFIGERPEGYDVLHANGDCQDNRLENLSYDTRSENTIDHYRYGSKNPGGKLSIEQVLKIRKLYSENKYSTKEIADMFNIGTSQVHRIGKLESYAWLNDDGTIDDSNTAVS